MWKFLEHVFKVSRTRRGAIALLLIIIHVCTLLTLRAVYPEDETQIELRWVLNKWWLCFIALLISTTALFALILVVGVKTDRLVHSILDVISILLVSVVTGIMAPEFIQMFTNDVYASQKWIAYVTLSMCILELFNLYSICHSTFKHSMDDGPAREDNFNAGRDRRKRRDSLESFESSNSLFSDEFLDNFSIRYNRYNELVLIGQSTGATSDDVDSNLIDQMGIVLERSGGMYPERVQTYVELSLGAVGGRLTDRDHQIIADRRDASKCYTISGRLVKENIEIETGRGDREASRLTISGNSSFRSTISTPSPSYNNEWTELGTVIPVAEWMVQLASTIIKVAGCGERIEKALNPEFFKIMESDTFKTLSLSRFCQDLMINAAANPIECGDNDLMSQGNVLLEKSYSTKIKGKQNKTLFILKIFKKNEAKSKQKKIKELDASPSTLDASPSTMDEILESARNNDGPSLLQHSEEISINIEDETAEEGRKEDVAAIRTDDIHEQRRRASVRPKRRK